MGGNRSFIPLSGSHRFDAVFSEGARVRRGGVTVVAMAREAGPARVGFVTGRRVGGAVVRNLAKRRLRTSLDRVELEDGFDYVVVASPSVATASFEAVTEWVVNAVVRSAERADSNRAKSERAGNAELSRTSGSEPGTPGR